ncbi:MAG: GNAT family N-acetyltransferase, partial [Saprospiraceae bacterium]|nr:GNAT family N-acetyltransferase [Saprospiraceae bacterium]
MNFTIRQLKMEDTVNFVKLLNKVDGESDYTYFEVGERSTTPFQVASNLATGQQTIFIAELAGRMVGQLSLNLKKEKCLEHSASLGIVILKAYWGQGLGRLLLDYADEWANDQGVSRLEVEVMAVNDRATAFFLQNGYVEEGTRRNAIWLHGEYVDEK